MTPTRDEVRARLGSLDAAPAPRPEFVARLGDRLRAIDPRIGVPEPPPVRLHRVLPGMLALGAATAVIAVLFVLLPTGPRSSQIHVTGNPPAAEPDGEAGATNTPADATTTTTLPGSIPTTAPGPAPRSTGSGGATNRDQAVPSLPPGPTTPATPVTTQPPRTDRSTTTTTRPPEPEIMSLTCVAGQPEGQPGIQCDWNQSTAPSFASYRLWRASGTNPKEQIASIPVRTITRYIDRPAAGEVEHYQVEALDSEGRVIGRSPIVEAICC